MTVPPGEDDDDEVDDDSTVVESYEDEDAVTADAGMSAQQTSQNAETETMSAEILESNMLASTQQQTELANLTSTLSTISAFDILNGTIASENIANMTLLNSAESTIPIHWECEASKYNSTDGCDCDCGAWDPDCGEEVPKFSGTFSDQCIAPDGLHNMTAIAEHCAEFGTCDFIFIDGTGLEMKIHPRRDTQFWRTCWISRDKDVVSSYAAQRRFRKTKLNRRRCTVC